MKAHWSQLKPKQQSDFGNGCGFNIKALHLEDKLLNASCRHHDFNYSRGGSQLDRFVADSDFMIEMMLDIKQSSMSIKKKKTYIRRSILFYILVRTFGWISFRYGRYLTLGEIIKRDNK